MSLRTLQSQVLSALTETDPPPLPSGTLREAGPATGEDRLAAYRSIIEANHLEALDQVYRVTGEVLGRGYWHRLLRGSPARIGSADRDLNEYGHHVPGLLRTAGIARPELSGFEYLPDLAALEWQIHLTRLARDDEPFDWSSFANSPQEQQQHAVLELSHSLSTIVTAFPVDTIWCLHSDRKPPEETPGPYTLCVFRETRFDAGVARLDEDEAHVMRLLQARTPLGEMEYRLAASARADVVPTVMGWVRRGWITSCRLGQGHV